MYIGTERLLIRQVLQTDESAIQYTAYGKPFLPGGSPFNLTHSGGYTALVKAGAPVGVDMEQIQAGNLSLIPHLFSRKEADWIHADPLPRFHMLWSIKESIMKATGLGMQLSPQSFEIDPEAGQSFVNGQQWFFRYTQWQNLSVAVACALPFPALCIHPLTCHASDAVF